MIPDANSIPPVPSNTAAPRAIAGRVFTVVGGDLLGVPVPVWVLLIVALVLTIVRVQVLTPVRRVRRAAHARVLRLR